MFQIEDRKLGDQAAVILRDDTAGSRVTIVPARGGLVTSLVACGREWLYMDERTLHDPNQNVRGGIPILFPSPGKLEGDRWARGGRWGTMRQHGFARTSAFQEIGRSMGGAAAVTLALSDSDVTRAAFPWPFRFTMRFSLRDASLTLTASVVNLGDEAMPFAIGYHPYFVANDATKGQCDIPTGATRAWDNVEKRERVLGSLDLTAPEVDLHLVDHGSNGATLDTPDGTVDLGGHFSRWVIWTLRGRDFVCLEPWTAPGNALNTGEGIVELPPGGERTFALTIAVRLPTTAPPGDGS